MAYVKLQHMVPYESQYFQVLAIVLSKLAKHLQYAVQIGFPGGFFSDCCGQKCSILFLSFFATKLLELAKLQLQLQQNCLARPFTVMFVDNEALLAVPVFDACESKRASLNACLCDDVT